MFVFGMFFSHFTGELPENQRRSEPHEGPQIKPDQVPLKVKVYLVCLHYLLRHMESVLNDS